MDLNLGPAPMADDLIKDVSEATFMSDVIEASQTTPVIVDFWAPWCGPCKTLGPQLEGAVRAAKGAVKMAKVNIDESPNAPSQYGVRGIPTLLLFKDGEVVDQVWEGWPAFGDSGVGEVPEVFLVEAPRVLGRSYTGAGSRLRAA